MAQAKPKRTIKAPISATRKSSKKVTNGLSSEQKAQVLTLIAKNTKALEKKLLTAEKEISKLKEKNAKAVTTQKKTTTVKKGPATKAKTAHKPGRKPQSKFTKTAKKVLHSVEHAVGLE